jgi:hypothetical protein
MNKSDKPKSPIGLLDTLKKRQDLVMARILTFLSVTSVLALSGFFVTSIIQWFTGTMPTQHRGLITISNPTLGVLIALLLTLVSVLVMWIFVFWSLFLIPFITIQAYRVSRRFEIPAGTKVLRWAQLWISTFLPIAIFAVVWNSIANPDVNAKLNIQSLEDLIIVAVGAVVVVALLWCINLIPSRFVTIHIPLLSSLLYTTLFITYGWGFGLASNSMLFGVLIYLTFGLDKFEELARRITIYDIDPEVADKLGALLTQVQMAEAQRDTTKVKELAFEVKKEKLEQMGKSSQIEMDEFLLEMLQSRFDRAQETFDILSSAMSKKLDEKIQKEIEKLRKEAASLGQEELSKRTSAIMAQINSASKDIPDQLQIVRDQVIDAGKQYQEELQAIEQRRTATALLEDSNQMIKRQRASLLTVSVNSCFDRIRNMIKNQPGIELLTRDKLLLTAESTQKVFLTSIERGNLEKIDSLIAQLNATLSTFVKIDELVRKRPEEKALLDQSEKVALELDNIMKRCLLELSEVGS